MMHWLTERRRKKLLETPYPEAWHTFLETNVNAYRYLDADERAHLRDLTQVFISEKHWEGCGGLELTDEMRVTIAATACLLIMGRDHELMKEVESILVYPTTMLLPPPPRSFFDPSIRVVEPDHAAALDPVLMYDGRAADLVEQARGAILDHTGTTVAPSDADLEAIAAFEQTPQFFTSNALAAYAAGGPPPVLPEGNTESEKRGRRFFDDVPIQPPSTRGICALCHSGPMLNESNGKNPIPVPPFFVPKGERFQSILSGEFLPNADPFRAYQFTDPDGNVQISVASDPGRALATGDFRGFPFGDLGKFKIPSLWNVSRTAPYFHNNAAKSLEDVVEHYATFFPFATPIALPGAEPIVFTEQDKADLLAYLKLL